MVKKHKKSSNKKHTKKYNKASMKDILAKGGEISSSIGVVMAWIVGVIFILIGIFMIVIGIDPSIIFSSTNVTACPKNQTQLIQTLHVLVVTTRIRVKVYHRVTGKKLRHMGVSK